jgi:hypothetical protein
MGFVLLAYDHDSGLEIVLIALHKLLGFVLSLALPFDLFFSAAELKYLI